MTRDELGRKYQLTHFPKLLQSDLELRLVECKLKIRTNQEPRCVAFSRLVPMPMATQKISSFARDYFWKLDRRFFWRCRHQNWQEGLDVAGAVEITFEKWKCRLTFALGRGGSLMTRKRLIPDFNWTNWSLKPSSLRLYISRCGPVDSFSSIIGKLELTLFNAADLLFSHRRFFISAMLSRKLFSVVNWREQFRPTALNTTCSAHAHSRGPFLPLAAAR